MSLLYIQFIAIPQFLIVGIVLLYGLSRIRLWAYPYQWRRTAMTWALYVPYCISVIVLLMSVLPRYQVYFNQNPNQLLGMMATLLLGVPTMSYFLLMLADPGLNKRQKIDKVQKHFSFVDSILLFVLAQPVIYVSLILNSTKTTPTTAIGVAVFSLSLAGIIIYKLINLSRLMNERKLWWVILAEWILLIAAYFIA